MFFSLTDELKDNIIMAMENQEQKFVLDAAKTCITPIEESICVDEENYYILPEWNPAAGYALRETFVANLHTPVARDELQDILHSGRGVFKNFRLALKKYPEIDKRWHIYKHRAMSARVNDWYNELREIWGLEKLDYLPESDESLVHEDFSFEVYTKADYSEVLSYIKVFFQEEEQNLSKEIKNAFYEMWKTQFDKAEAIEQIGIICRSLSEDFAGCVTAAELIENQEKIMVLTSLFVPEYCRGLGIGTELITMCVSKIQEHGKEWIIVPNFIVPEVLEPLFQNMGFEKTRAGYVGRIQNL